MSRVASLPVGACFESGQETWPRASTRQAIDQAMAQSEAEVLASCLSWARLSPERTGVVDAQARQWVQALRDDAMRHPARVQDLLRQFPLSSDEGVALMCLAEALLRIPDAATRDALIHDKLTHADWSRHLGHGHSLFGNAAHWGLWLTGRLFAPRDAQHLAALLSGVLARLGAPVVRAAFELAVRRLGSQFIAGQTIEQALPRAHALEAQGFRFSYDMLGEAALTHADAERYTEAYAQAIRAIGAASAGRGVYDGPGVSVKLSALHPRYANSQRPRVMAELWPRLLCLAELARDANVGLNLDAEEVERLDLSLDLFERLCHAPSLKGWQGLGFVVQAYQKRCLAVVDFLMDLARRTQRTLMVRLVKGAYWDSEIKRAQVEGLPDYPVFTRKHHTDVAYLACARKLLGAHHNIYPQFATHNAHTVAAIGAWAEQVGAQEGLALRYEFQCLHGMGEALYKQVMPSRAVACRIYAPVGAHETLLPYLVRRLLENGANSSFVHQLADPSVSVDELVHDPVVRALQGEYPHPALPLPSALYGPVRRNAQGLDFSRATSLHALQLQMQAQASTALRIEPMGAFSVEGAEVTPIRNPADLHDVIGEVRHASMDDVAQALDVATRAFADWSGLSPAQRADILSRAADGLEADTSACMALVVREAGKTWRHALDEVREAVDFLRFDAAQIRHEFDNRTHLPLGPVVCISPWNFPLAIFVGQIAAALAAGNTVLAKPAEQTSAIAARVVTLLWQAGVPRGALQLLPGRGPEVGMALARDPRVQGVLFTGSTETAHVLQRTLALRCSAHGTPVILIAETGGQNAMVVDASAQPEQVVADVMRSAFEAAGQRCSALRVLCLQHEIADRVLELLKGAMAEAQLGVPAQWATDIGPVIDARAQRNIARHIARMRAQGCHVTSLARHDPQVLHQGTYVMPTLIDIDHIGQLEREVFGPVLHVLRYRHEELDRLLQDIHATGYALTLGIHSRIEDTIARVIAGTRAGNVYVNRSMVGAVVGVQPFGGEGLSGTGPKAGGPLYLLRLLHRMPQDAALRSIQSLDTTVQTLPAPGLQALCDWATAHQQRALAAICERFQTSHPAGIQATLSGPTGERNRYLVTPRARVLCWTAMHPTAQADRLTQLAAVLAVGACAVWPRSAQALFEQLPPQVQTSIQWLETDQWQTTQTALRDAPLDAVLAHAAPSELGQLAQVLAQRCGAIVPLAGLPVGSTDIPWGLLVRERSISINTTASSGNIDLLTHGPDEPRN